MTNLVSFMVGAFICNALPHLVSGLRGEAFYTPWARPRGVGRSSAVQNFAWGSTNLLIAFAISRQEPIWTSSNLVISAIGFLLVGSGLSILFSRRNRI